jgi:prepilin-type N-terminal cleavage/methylation domain-containing protein
MITEQRQDVPTDADELRRRCSGFSLAELLAALTIGSMVLVAVLTIYGRAERAAAAVTRRLDDSQLPGEILQRIAEDLDHMVSPGSGTKIKVANRYDEGFAAAKLEITRTILDDKNKEQVLEQIVWQSCYDVESALPGLVLYRSHSGISLEDKLLDGQRSDTEKLFPFVPICAGVTMFRIDIPQGEEFIERWDSDAAPNGVRISLSFAEAVKATDGTFEVPEELQIVRTMATDRTRKIRFNITPVGDANGQGFAPNTPNMQQPGTGQPGLTNTGTNVPAKPKTIR